MKLTLEYRRQCLSVVLLQTLLVVLGMSTLGMTGWGIDFLKATATGSADSVRWPLGMAAPAGWPPVVVLVCLSTVILIVALITAGLRYMAALASAALSQEVLIRMRTEIYAKLQQLSFHFYDAGESSSIIEAGK